VAQRFGVCVLAITHLNKGSGMKAMHRVTGSIAFTAAARVVFAVARDEADPEGKRRLFVPIKNNLGNDQTGLSFGTDVVRIGGDILAPRIAWGDEVTITADEALSPPPEEERGAMEEAREFLRSLLADGPVAADRVKAEARGAGIAERTLKRAKSALKIHARKAGMREGWEWVLP
jgi:putative DNA primase/helicase